MRTTVKFIAIVFIAILCFGTSSYSKEISQSQVLYPEYEGKPGVEASDIEVEYDLTWHINGQTRTNYSGISSVSFMDGKLHEKGSGVVRFYRAAARAKGRYRDFIYVPFTPIISEVLGASGTYNMKMNNIVTQGGGAAARKGEQETGVKCTGTGDTFELELYAGNYFIAIPVTTNIPGSMPFEETLRPGTHWTTWHEGLGTPLYFRGLSYSELKNGQLIIPVDLMSKIDPSNNVMLATSLTSAMGQIRLTLAGRGGICYPFDGLREGIDYKIGNIEGSSRTLGECGWDTKAGRPVITLNKEIWSELSDEGQRSVMAHEVEHRRQFLNSEFPFPDGKSLSERFVDALQSPEKMTRFRLREYQAFSGEIKAYSKQMEFDMECVENYAQKALTLSDIPIGTGQYVLYTPDGEKRTRNAVRDLLENEMEYSFDFRDADRI